MMAWLRVVLIATLCVLAGTAAVVIVVGSPEPRTAEPVGGAKPDLNQLSEAMLIDESVVPQLPGTSWGRMVAVPRGPEPQVSPAGCELFLSQGAASQKGLAMRSSKNAAIGVAVSVTEQRPDLAELVRQCRVFTFEGPNASSVVTLGPLDVRDLPDGAIATLDQVGQPTRRVALPRRSDAECLADELARLDSDEVYERVLHDGLRRLHDRRTMPAAEAVEQGLAPSPDG